MFSKTVSLLALAASALGHMELIAPCPRYSDKCATQPALPAGESIDYDLNAPIGSNGAVLQPLCKHTTAWPSVTDTWTAGQSVTIQFAAGGATHLGGDCEFSISYDGGKTFVVLHQELRYCFYTASPDSGGVDSVRSYTFELPSNLPGTDHAVFSWSWVNASGNREFYNNCGDVAVVGSAGSYTGKSMTIGNYGAGYPVIAEFLGNYNTGIEYYTTNTTDVTVSGSGYTSSGSGGSSGSSSSAAQDSTTDAAQASTTDASQATTTTDAAQDGTTTAAGLPTSSAPAISAPSSAAETSAASGGTDLGECTSAKNGQYLCSSDGSSAVFNVCDNGTWNQGSCDSGTVCKQSGTTIYCAWAS
ncbi:hypothetical protein EV178_003433 [Coemansia sp. RSA 1646]|nr:hypothetical protein EV178_003433 [Coemansia sp. RSA 1646]